MSAEENHNRPEPEEIPSSDKARQGQLTARGGAGIEEPDISGATGVEQSEVPGTAGQGPKVQTSSPSPAPEAAKVSPSEMPRIASPRKAKRFFEEEVPGVIEVAPRALRRWTRRDLLLFGAGSVAALAGFAYVLPQDTLQRLGLHRQTDTPRKEWFMNRALRLDDDVAEALYSPKRMAPTYAKSQITPLMNNYNGATPDPSYIPGWRLTLEGLASGLSVSLDLRTLVTRFRSHEQITRLVCVEGWSAIAWWSGLRFDDLLHAYPPVSQARWARVDSSVNLDSDGNPDPYYMSLDLATARHPQTLLATHYNGKPLTVEHGAPLRLLAPVKLGLKNVKAVTKITYTAKEPKDYWAERGYSWYDGI
ncbi:MAG TPA: molybdopterin-dependent oxidoreductase [Terriglobia bacterium]|nr:molybdopterin-dependent oxidoreductase [Terriglobia bacterium]